MPDPKSLQVGDRVRFVSLPDEWARRGYTVHGESIEFMKQMIKRSWPARVYQIDEHGYPWIAARIRENGQYHHHTWAIMEFTGWRLVQRR